MFHEELVEVFLELGDSSLVQGWWRICSILIVDLSYKLLQKMHHRGEAVGLRL